MVAAIFAASRGASVDLLESSRDGGRKILISGGGRCNVLPSELAPHRFVSDSPAHLVRTLLRAWPLHEQRAFFERDVGVPLALEVESGKYFPVSNRARDVRDGLLAMARERGVRVCFDTRVTGVEPVGGGWTVETTGGRIDAARVVFATGGLSVPSTGSDGAGIAIVERLGHRVVPTYPALTPLLGGSGRGHASLAGVSLTARLRARFRGKTIETSGGFLFTHRGYSGPAVLDISHAVTHPSRGSEPPAVRVQWGTLGADEWTTALSGESALVSTLVSRHVPARLADQLMAEAGVPTDRRASDLRRAERTALVERLTSYDLPVDGDEGYKKAEVTGGGVALDEVHPRTLESRRCPGLYLCGELLDAFGPIGGHNFAWAWSTGHTVGLSAAL